MNRIHIWLVKRELVFLIDVKSVKHCKKLTSNHVVLKATANVLPRSITHAREDLLLHSSGDSGRVHSSSSISAWPSS